MVRPAPPRRPSQAAHASCPSNSASEPHCATAVVIWQHGKYYFHNNGSLTIDPSPFVADGRVQVQNPCAATTEVLTYYAQFELYNSWTITIDVHHAAFMLQLYRFDGSLFPRYGGLRLLLYVDGWLTPPSLLFRVGCI